MPIFTFTTLDDPLAINGTFATGINASGQVVGSYNDAGGTAHGFISGGGTYTTFNDPDAAGGDTLPDGINNLGQIAGTFNNFPVQELGFIKIGNSYPFIVYPLLPNPIDQNPWAHWRSPMDMMRQGWSTSLFHAAQQWSTRSS